MTTRFMRRAGASEESTADDPLDGVANLFDVAIVFAVGLMFALVSAYRLMDLMDPNADVTVTKQTADGRLEVITKKGREVKIQKVTEKSLSGEGNRLGTAYQLKDGRIIYVPDERAAGK